MGSIEVYKTDVEDRVTAKSIVDTIRQSLPNCNPSFDLEDCDKVLRVESLNDEINESKIRNILQDYGYHMENLP
ncbi:hypothetical protein [Fodinibius halophilus]|uniref:Heavy-metal-associated domain-containing protein n=1 Tax=Fodinibius halophilus TaxID=1736908 RepID=A0A6M1TEM5_9BACT|nr:hypothetical protein [Fodinibius halophilus]NGP87090.1 hypothetical protein [Fodinibius halophilus]